MLTHGSDRARHAGDKVILHSPISKGWTPRVAKTLTSPEHPGTTVLWDEQYFEVLEAGALPSGGIRYVLGTWPDHHTIRTFQSYDADSEAARVAAHERARRQRRAGLLAQLSGIVLGFLPAAVQMRLQNELGVLATRMTLLSCLVPLVLTGICVYIQVGATIGREAPIPFPLWLLCGAWMLETFIRFYVVMTQSRPMGSLIGELFYAIFGKRETLRGDSVAFAPPAEDVALRDALTLKEPLLTLLAPAEQKALADRVGFDYKRTASGVAWTILVAAAVGAYTSKDALSMLVAAALACEQLVRLVKLRREPVGSVFGIVVRPFVRELLK